MAPSVLASDIIGTFDYHSNPKALFRFFADTKEKYKISYHARLHPKTTVMLPMPPESFMRTVRMDYQGPRPHITVKYMVPGVEELHPPWR